MGCRHVSQLQAHLRIEKICLALIGHIFVAGLQAIQAVQANTDNNKFHNAGRQEMAGNIVVNTILAGILYGLYLWTPWASLVIAAFSSFAFGFIFVFDKDFLNEIAPDLSSKFSLMIGAGMSLCGVVISLISLVK